MNPNYGELNGILLTLMDRIDDAGKAVDGTLQPVFFVAGCLMLVFACIKFMWQKNLAPLAAFVIQFIMLMGIITLSSQWMPVTQGYTLGMGAYGAQIGGFVMNELSPGTVIMKGLRLADKMYTENISWMRVLFGTNEDTTANVVMLLACLLTIGVSLLMAVFLMMFFVLMKLASVVALVFLVFLLFEWSRFMAAPGVARILAYGIQMLVMSLVAGMMFTTLDALKLSDRLEANEAITTLAIVTFFAFLFYNTTTIAREQISGMPILSLNEFGNALGKAALFGASMMPGVAKAGLGALGGMPGRPTMPDFRGTPGPGGTGSPGHGGSGGSPSSYTGGGFRPGGGPGTIDAEWTEARDLAPPGPQRLLAQYRREQEERTGAHSRQDEAGDLPGPRRLLEEYRRQQGSPPSSPPALPPPDKG